MKKLTLTFLATWLGLAAGLYAVEPPVADSIVRLPVTTGWLGNTLLRGGQDDWWGDTNQTYLQLYTDDVAVSPEGMVFCTTTWEEGHRAAGIYFNGDALPDCPTLGVNSGSAVAVSDHWLIYGQQGKLAIFNREPGKTYQVASGHHWTYAEEKDAPKTTGLAIDEPRDRVYIADSSGVVRTWQLSTGKPINAQGFAAPRVGKLRLDKEGNLWSIQEATLPTYKTITATAFGSEPAEIADQSHTVSVANATSTKGDQDYWIGKDNQAFIGLDFGQPQQVDLLRFNGAGINTTYIGAKLQGSTAGPQGPWTDLVEFKSEPRWWPETAITIDSRPWRALRIFGSKTGIRGLVAEMRTTAIAGAIIKYSPEGKELARIGDSFSNPTAIAYDPANNRLLVFDNNSRQQIMAFNDLNGIPKIDTTFGVDGYFGNAGGLVRANGEFGPQRFDSVNGLNLDSTGNLFVWSKGGTGISQSRLECYDPKGALLWNMTGLAFLDSADLDPAQTDDAWSCSARYKRDPQARDGDLWQSAGTTVDQFSYPDDPRLNQGGAQVLAVRRIHGQRFLFTASQWSDPVSVFRFDPKRGDIAIPSAFISGRHSGRPWPANQPPGAGILLWRDATGDGSMQPAEYEKDDDLNMSPINVDYQGNLWIMTPDRGLWMISAGEKLDANGVPAWSLQSQLNRRYPAPEAFSQEGSEVRGLEIAPDGNTVFVFGFTKEFPNAIGHNLPLGRLMVQCRPEGTKLVEVKRLLLPYDCDFRDQTTIKASEGIFNGSHDQPYSSAIAGDYLFVGYEQRMTVLAYHLADLTLAGQINIGPQSLTPIFDGPPELVAAQRGEEYVLFMPQYLGNATTAVTWNPKQAKRLPEPTTVSVSKQQEQVKLTWQADPKAKRFIVQKRQCNKDGWGTWQDVITDAEGTDWLDHASANPVAYRLRAIGDEGAISDWSKTIYLR